VFMRIVIQAWWSLPCHSVFTSQCHLVWLLCHLY